MDEIEKIRKSKQQYLQKNILDNDLDAYEFSDFLGTQKLDGENIDNWNLEELESQVEYFKQQKSLKSERDDNEALNMDNEQIYLKTIKC